MEVNNYKLSRQYNMGGGAVWGVTQLNNRVYVVSGTGTPNVINVYNSAAGFQRLDNIIIKTDNEEEVNPGDLVSFQKQSLLYLYGYVMKRRNEQYSCAIWRINVKDDNDIVVDRWSIPDENGYRGTMSVTSGGRLVLVSNKKRQIHVLTPAAKLILSIDLPATLQQDLCHAVETRTGDYLVSQGTKDFYFDINEERQGTNEDRALMHRICLVSKEGRLLKSFGGKPCGAGLRELHQPVYMVLDCDGNVLVADYKNSRVLMIDKELEKSFVIVNLKEQILEDEMKESEESSEEDEEEGGEEGVRQENSIKVQQARKDTKVQQPDRERVRGEELGGARGGVTGRGGRRGGGGGKGGVLSKKSREGEGEGERKEADCPHRLFLIDSQRLIIGVARGDQLKTGHFDVYNVTASL